VEPEVVAAVPVSSSPSGGGITCGRRGRPRAPARTGYRPSLKGASTRSSRRWSSSPDRRLRPRHSTRSMPAASGLAPGRGSPSRGRAQAPRRHPERRRGRQRPL